MTALLLVYILVNLISDVLKNVEEDRVFIYRQGDKLFLLAMICMIVDFFVYFKFMEIIIERAKGGVI